MERSADSAYKLKEPTALYVMAKFWVLPPPRTCPVHTLYVWLLYERGNIHVVVLAFGLPCPHWIITLLITQC